METFYDFNGDIEDLEVSVTDLMGGPTGTSPASAATAVPVITVLAKAYTRGRGFDGNVPNDEIAAVITIAAARLAANGPQGLWRKKVDNVEYERRSFFSGWSLAELAVLNRYRVRAM